MCVYWCFTEIDFILLINASEQNLSGPDDENKKQKQKKK